MLSTAVDDELIVRNPCRVKGGGVERSPERPLPIGDEVWQLADAIDDRYRALVLLAAFVACDGAISSGSNAATWTSTDVSFTSSARWSRWTAD